MKARVEEDTFRSDSIYYYFYNYKMYMYRNIVLFCYQVIHFFTINLNVNRNNSHFSMVRHAACAATRVPSDIPWTPFCEAN